VQKFIGPICSKRLLFRTIKVNPVNWQLFDYSVKLTHSILYELHKTC